MKSNKTDATSDILHLTSHIAHTPRNILITGDSGFIGYNDAD